MTAKKILLLLSVLVLAACSSSTDQKKSNERISKFDERIKETGKMSVEKEVYYTEDSTVFNPLPIKIKTTFDNELAQSLTVHPTTVTGLKDALSFIPFLSTVVHECEANDDSDDDSSGVLKEAADTSVIEYKHIDHDGDVASYLLKLASMYDYDIEFRESAVYFNECVTKTFMMSGSQIDKSVTFGNGGSATDTGMEYEITSEEDHWESLITSLKGLISSKGSLVENRNLGIVNISDKPNAIHKSSTFINEYNQIAERQVKFLITIIRYQHEELEEQGIDFNLRYNSSSLIGDMGNNFPGGAASTVIGLEKVGGALDGSKLDISSLAQNDFLSIETSAEVTAMNALPVPFNVIERMGYVSDIEYERDTGSDIETRKLVTEDLEIGFSMMLMSILNNSDDITLSISLLQSELLGFDTIGDVQLPRMTENSMFQTVRMKRGDSLLLTGFKQSKLEDAKSTTLPNTFLLGGKKNDSNERSNIAIMIESM
ncbi:toxin coregulated pilus biosynthesis outer membrane protein C [Psychromonas marina]|uniref:Toxin coregulated pilus biosynthesis outer membrane protein C n=1 Tax=Psychromonas marina TaxID=88364 RepID=A0ABQ6E359_9GAMM|nr:hypothetical protein [Psychromonas marina]GLS91817.1 toxin coregulated pilus biosynthesis outer membrane protein C [Psychromonas marina]